MFPIFVFPHSHMDVNAYKTIGNVFDPIIICQPWYMEAPFHHHESGDFPLVQVQRPLDSMKPKGDFLKLLSEYRLWMKQNHDKGYAVYLKVAQDMASYDDTPWELRRMIKQMGEDFLEPSVGDTFKWHIILHLASEFEKNRQDAEEILELVRIQKSPLKDALEEGDLSKSVFGDLPVKDILTLNNDSHLRQIFEAWFGLFGDFISDDSLFVTFDKQVSEFAISLFEDKAKRFSSDNAQLVFLEKRLDHGRFHLNQLPFFEAEMDAQRDPVMEGLSGKTIILITN